MLVLAYLFLRYFGKIPKSRISSIRAELLFLLGKSEESEVGIDLKIREENLDFLYELASRRACNYKTEANSIDKKAGAALTLMGITAAAFFFSQEFTSLESLSQVLYAFLFLVIVYFLLRALSNNNFAEPPTYQIIERNIQKDMREVKIDLLRTYHRCDRANQKLLQYKKDAYNTALIAITFSLAFFLLFMAIFADATTDESGLLETLVAILFIALTVGVSDAIKPIRNSSRHRKRLEKIFIKD